jgi:rod shape-determining protein MreB and related proteins
MTEVTGVPCYVADDPLSCVAIGTGLALEYFDIIRDSLEELSTLAATFHSSRS